MNSRDNNIMGKVFYVMKKGDKVNKAALASNQFSIAHCEMMIGKLKKSKLYSLIFLFFRT